MTAIEPASTFYVAEDYHQNYLENNPTQPYCMFVVAPKAQKDPQEVRRPVEGERVTGL